LYVTIITEFKSGNKPLKVDFLHQKYVVEGLSIRQISELTASSKDTIRTALHRNKIEVRERGQHHGNPSQLKYGMKRNKLNSDVHKTKQRTIDSVRQMRQEGLSLRAIARCLNLMKVPTKNRGVKWHPEMVRRILS